MRLLFALLVFICALSVDASPPQNRVFDQLGTTTPLDAGETFTSIWVDVQRYNSLMVSFKSSNSFTFDIEFSPDAVNVDESITRTFRPGRRAPPERFTVGYRFVRLMATNNSGTDMTSLRIQVIAGDKTLFSVPADTILPQRTDSIPVRVDKYDLDVALERREGAVNKRKFGFNSDVDIAALETVWSFGGRWQRLPTAQTLEISSSSANDTAGGSGVRQIKLGGVGPDYGYQVETIALNGISTVTTSNIWLGVNDFELIEVGSGGVNAGNITVTGSVSATTQVYMVSGEGASQQAIFTVPENRTLLIEGFLINTRRVQGGGTPRVTIYLYYYDTDVGSVRRVFRLDKDTEVENVSLVRLPNAFVVRETDAIEFVAQTTADDTTVNVNFWGVELQDP